MASYVMRQDARPNDPLFIADHFDALKKGERMLTNFVEAQVLTKPTKGEVSIESHNGNSKNKPFYKARQIRSRAAQYNN